jgi:dienelactone hydrolase
MASIALFHSVLGVRPGITDAAERLRAAGHDALVVDQYDGKVFDDYDEAGRYVEEVGFPALMERAVEAVHDLPDGFVAAGFSNGAGMAVLGAASWPAGVPAQLHRASGDPHASAEWDEALAADVTAAGGVLGVVRYETSGHLFTDPSLPAEYDAAATERFWREALAFVERAAG